MKKKHQFVPPPPREETPEAMARIDKLLKIGPAYGSPSSLFVEDWDLCLSDSERVTEFMGVYEDTDEEDFRFALMQLILVSFEDGIRDGTFDRKLWSRIANALLLDFDVHVTTVWYWARVYSSRKHTELGKAIREVWKEGTSRSSR